MDLSELFADAIRDVERRAAFDASDKLGIEPLRWSMEHWVQP